MLMHLAFNQLPDNKMYILKENSFTFLEKLISLQMFFGTIRYIFVCILAH